MQKKKILTKRFFAKEGWGGNARQAKKRKRSKVRKIQKYKNFKQKKTKIFFFLSFLFAYRPPHTWKQPVLCAPCVDGI